MTMKVDYEITYTCNRCGCSQSTENEDILPPGWMCITKRGRSQYYPNPAHFCFDCISRFEDLMRDSRACDTIELDAYEKGYNEGRAAGYTQGVEEGLTVGLKITKR